MLSSPQVKAHLTSHTCGEACWEAREEVCHCSCGGRNHGILRGGAERPKRTCKIEGFWYEMHAVGNRNEALAECRKIREEVQDGQYDGFYKKVMVYYSSKPGDKFHCKAATRSQEKWKEISDMNLGWPYIIWKRIESPLG